MSTYQPGTVAVATVRGEPNIRVVVADADDPSMPWIALGGRHVGDWIAESDATDVRPLVVLDAVSLGMTTDGMVRHLRWLAQHTAPKGPFDQDEMAHASSCGKVAQLADAIEAQTKPPRIPEPGLWGVVKAWRKDETESDVCEWVRGRGLTPWRCECGKKAIWSNLVDPVLIREGVES